MAERLMLELNPQLPPVTSLDIGSVIISYDDLTDTLFVHLTGIGKAAVSVEIAPDIFWRVDPQSGVVIGFQIEAALSRVAIDIPDIVSLAETAGAPKKAIERARDRITPDATTRSAVASLFNLPGLTHSHA